MGRVSSSCCLEGSGCQCFLPSQPWAYLGLFLYFPLAQPTPLMVLHNPSSPQGGGSHSPLNSWGGQHRTDQAQDQARASQAAGYYRVSANDGKIIFTGYACRSHASILGIQPQPQSQ